MESIWSGDVEDGYFSTELFDKRRLLVNAETEPTTRVKGDSSMFYVMGVDVGRFGCTTEVAMIKVSPKAESSKMMRQLVNIYTIEAEHFKHQDIVLKRLFKKFKCRGMCVDANGPGLGLVEMLTVESRDPDTGEVYPGLGVINDDDNHWKKVRTDSTIPNALFAMKATRPLNSEMYSYLRGLMQEDRMRFLIDENVMKSKLLSTKAGKAMSQEERADFLVPYTQTSILREQLANLVCSAEGIDIILKQGNSRIPKDKVSALIYGTYLSKVFEEKMRKRKRGSVEDMMFFTSH